MKWILNTKKFIENLDYHNKPRESLEKIVEYAQEHPLIDRILKGTKTYQLLLKLEDRIKERGSIYAAQKFLEDLDVKYNIVGAENIPNNGSAVYVVNHPYGIVDSLALFGGLGGILESKGRKLKVIGTHLLKMVRGIEDIILFVDSSENPFRKTPLKQYKSSIINVLHSLHTKGDIATFPAGQISGEKLKEFPWNISLGKLVKRSDCIVPMWFTGPDHCIFYNFLARKNFHLRNILTFVEAWNKAGETITLRIGKTITKNEIEKIGADNAEITNYIRQKAEALKYS